MKHAYFFKHVAVVSAGGLLAKAIGVVYRIPLANALGGYGMGLYQMAYPLFCLVLTLCSAGVSAAMARAVASGAAEGRAALFAALRLFAVPGTLGMLLLCLLALLAAGWQGERGLVGCYLALAPAVPFTALIAVLRGYFQGRREMFPSAASEVFEQLVKAGAGLFFAMRCTDALSAARAALFAVTMSEGASLLLLLVHAWGTERARTLSVRPALDTGMLFSAFPVMLTASLLPLSHMLDSVVIVRLLSRHTADAVALYGLLAGNAAPLVGLPATLCAGLTAAIVPAVAARGGGDVRRSVKAALLAAVGLGGACAAGLFVLARPVTALLYPSLTAGEGAVLVRILRISCASAVTLAGLNTLSAALTGMGCAKRAALALLTGAAVKLALQCLLVGDPRWSVYGAAAAGSACYLVAFLLDLVYTMVEIRKDGRSEHDHGHRFGRRARRRHHARACRAAGGGQSVCAHADASLGTKFTRRGDRV